MKWSEDQCCSADKCDIQMNKKKPYPPKECGIEFNMCVLKCICIEAIRYYPWRRVNVISVFPRSSTEAYYDLLVTDMIFDFSAPFIVNFSESYLVKIPWDWEEGLSQAGTTWVYRITYLLNIVNFQVNTIFIIIKWYVSATCSVPQRIRCQCRLRIYSYYNKSSKFTDG